MRALQGVHYKYSNSFGNSSSNAPATAPATAPASTLRAGACLVWPAHVTSTQDFRHPLATIPSHSFRYQISCTTLKTLLKMAMRHPAVSRRSRRAATVLVQQINHRAETSMAIPSDACRKNGRSRSVHLPSCPITTSANDCHRSRSCG